VTQRRGTTTSNGIERFCDCTEFKLWYVGEQEEVCECSHSRTDHIDDRRTCVGDVIIYPGIPSTLLDT